MQVPKVIGSDIELGNFLLGVESLYGTGAAAAQLLLNEFDGAPMRSTSTPAAQGDADWRGLNPGPVSPLDGWAPGGGGAAASSCDWGRKFLSGTGGCVYIDSDHLEIALPEARDAWTHVACFHAMLRLVQRAQRGAQGRLPDGVTLEVLANTSDGLGASYGAHLDFLVSRPTYRECFERRSYYLPWLASIQVSAIVISGQGKAGGEREGGSARFRLSQRGEFFDRLTSTDTMRRRGIVNRRDEPLCGTHSDLARMHVIFFDDMLAHVSRLITVGSMQLALSMLEAGCVDPGLVLESPVDALHAWDADPSLRATAPTVGGRTVTAVEFQRLFFREATRFVEGGRCEGLVPRAAEILMHWGRVLDALERRDLDRLAGSLDWVHKLLLLEGALAGRSRLTWRSPQIKALDHLYASLGDDGVFLAADAAGRFEHVVGEDAISRATSEPPDDTRAWTRAMLLRRWRPWVVSVNWDRVDFEIRERWSRRRCEVVLDDPTRYTRQECGELFAAELDLEHVVAALAARAGEPQMETGRIDTWNRDNGADRPNRQPAV